MEEIKKQTEEMKIDRFTIDDVLSTADLEAMSKKKMSKHIEKLEKIALSLDHGLSLAIKQLNIKVRAMNGEIL